MIDPSHGLIMEWIAARPLMSQYIVTGFGGRGARRALTTPLTPSAIWRVRIYATACNLAYVKPHDLRRFLGTEIVKKTGDIRKAQKALGHKSIETTARHYVLDDLQDHWGGRSRTFGPLPPAGLRR